LRETDLIRKGCNALMRTLESNNCGLEEVEDEDMELADMDVENPEENVVDENIIESTVHCFVFIWKCYIIKEWLSVLQRNL